MNSELPRLDRCTPSQKSFVWSDLISGCIINAPCKAWRTNDPSEQLIRCLPVSAAMLDIICLHDWRGRISDQISKVLGIKVWTLRSNDFISICNFLSDCRPMLLPPQWIISAWGALPLNLCNRLFKWSSRSSHFKPLRPAHMTLMCWRSNFSPQKELEYFWALEMIDEPTIHTVRKPASLAYN